MIDYLIIAWISFSLGIVFSQTTTGQLIILRILGLLDNAGIKSKKKESE